MKVKQHLLLVLDHIEEVHVDAELSRNVANLPIFGEGEGASRQMDECGSVTTILI